MNLQGPIGIRGRWHIIHQRNGKIIDEIIVKNTVTNTGKDSAAGLLGGLKVTGFTYLGIGTSETAAAAADTDLLAGIVAGSLARASSSVTQVQTDVANDTLSLTHSFACTGTYTIKEAGIFDTVTGGVLLARGTFSAKALENGDSLTVYYKVDLD